MNSIDEHNITNTNHGLSGDAGEPDESSTGVEDDAWGMTEGRLLTEGPNH